MKDNYDLKKLKKREGKLKVDPDAVKVQISLRMDASDLIGAKNEADRLGIPYQTLIGSIVHRYISGQLLDKREIELKKIS
jgi:predicted DNA binding CopG/RHH family protein